MGDEGELAAAKAAADLAEKQAGGVGDEVVIIDPSPPISIKRLYMR